MNAATNADARPAKTARQHRLGGQFLPLPPSLGRAGAALVRSGALAREPGRRPNIVRRCPNIVMQGAVKRAFAPPGALRGRSTDSGIGLAASGDVIVTVREKRTWGKQ
jgi:hypothetical protein